MEEVLITMAGPDDVAGALPLLAVQLAEHGMGQSDGALAAALGAIAGHPERGRVLIARRGADVVGLAVMPFTWTVEHGGLCAWLDELYVVPAERGRGIGTRLLQAVLETARVAGCRALDLEVDQDHARAESLYVRAGFTPLPRRRFARRL